MESSDEAPEISGKKQGKTGKGNPPAESRFKPGQSGNPLGKPRGTVSITKYIRAALQENDDLKARQLAEALIIQAAKGNGAAMKQILDRIDGAVKGEMELTSPDGSMKPQVIVYVPDNGRD